MFSERRALQTESSATQIFPLSINNCITGKFFDTFFAYFHIPMIHSLICKSSQDQLNKLSQSGANSTLEIIVFDVKIQRHIAKFRFYENLANKKPGRLVK